MRFRIAQDSAADAEHARAEQLASQRAKSDDWKRKAAERWHEIRSLRKQVGELERALAEARDAAQPRALPQRSAAGERPKTRARRSGSP